VGSRSNYWESLQELKALAEAINTEKEFENERSTSSDEGRVEEPITEPEETVSSDLCDGTEEPRSAEEDLSGRG